MVAPSPRAHARPPTPPGAVVELRRREAATDAQLAAWARLAVALAELERARAAELQRRLEQTYGKRRRLVEEAQGRIHEICARLRHHQDQDQERRQQQQPPA